MPHDPNTFLGVNTYGELFDEFWNTMNSRYQFWDVDTTDWDAMYTRYKPLFDKLDINNEDDQRKSVVYFTQMLAGTLDAHLELDFYPPAISGSAVFPRGDQIVAGKNPIFLYGLTQWTGAWYYFTTYYSIDSAHYLDGNYISGVYNGPDFPVHVLEGTIHSNILYFGFDACELTPALQDSGTNILKSAYNAFSQALNNDPNIKGVIVDMRANGGGFGQDAVKLASGMIDQRIVRGLTRYKNGTGRLDYTPWEPTYIDPAPGAKAIHVPLIILTDINTFSGAEHITSALHAVPGAVTVGTYTLGGHIGFMNDNMQGSRAVSYKSNSFGTNPVDRSFMTLGMSCGVFRNPDGSDTYWGLKPDYLVPFDTVAINAGIDPQLEKALTLIH
jgi:carboxyl-terminal processing protease